jgi:uncharacterized membrane protein SirB2
MTHVMARRRAYPDHWQLCRKHPGMPVFEFYPQIQWVHIACVPASGSLLAWRGLLTQVGCTGAAQRMPVRGLSYAIDTTLLTAPLMLVTNLPGAMFANGWLRTKLVLLALKHARTRGVRRVFFISALVTCIYMPGVARVHHPRGWLNGGSA